MLPVTDDELRTMRHGCSYPDEDGGHGAGDRLPGVLRATPPRRARHARSASTAPSESRPAPGVLEAIADADRLVIAPSNPIVSIDPVLAVPGVREAVDPAADDTVAVSPIVAGAALKGPADRMLPNSATNPRWWAWPGSTPASRRTLVIDEADAELAPAGGGAGIGGVVAPTVMSDDSRGRRRWPASRSPGRP